MRLITVAFNVVARYPGKIFQPYVGVGVGAFYFSSSGQIDGHQVVPGINAQVGLKVLATEEWGLFVEGKYNYATITNLDPSGYGLSGAYSAFQHSCRRRLPLLEAQDDLLIPCFRDCFLSLPSATFEGHVRRLPWLVPTSIP